LAAIRTASGWPGNRHQNQGREKTRLPRQSAKPKSTSSMAKAFRVKQIWWIWARLQGVVEKSGSVQLRR